MNGELILVAVVVLLVLVKVLDERSYARRFARSLAEQACPWCAAPYGAEGARQSMRGQPLRARAFVVRCLSCDGEQILTAGPTIDEFRERMKAQDEAQERRR